MIPVRNYKFKLEIDGTELGFAEISGYDAKIKEIQYREGNYTVNTARKLPGLTEYGQITLKRGTDTTLTLFKWINDVSTGNIQTKTVTLTALGDDGSMAASWKVINAWPVSYNISEFQGTGNEVVMETLVLTHEGMTRDS